MLKIEDLIESRNPSKEFSPNIAIIAKIARNFNLDGKLFIERFDILYSSELKNNLFFRAKASTDLTMSIECSLKAMFLALNKDSYEPIDILKKLKKLSHKVDNLFNELKIKNDSQVIMPEKPQKLFNEIEKLGVGSRYGIEIWKLSHSEDYEKKILDKDFISKTISNENWFSNFRKRAVEFNNSANQFYKELLAPHTVLFKERIKKFNEALDVFHQDCTSKNRKIS